MSKGVIYIDTEDDITSIVGKIKAAKDKIVALVPPARTGALQSAVNLRILARTAEKANKHLVLITNNPSLLPLAANAKIPVAKTLQSKPGIPKVEAIKIDDDVDVIDGASIPVEDYIKQSQPKEVKSKDAAVAALAAAESTEVDEPVAKAKSKKKTKPVPNFNTLRNKLMIGGGVLAVLIGVFVWLTFFQVKATVMVQANTSVEKLSTGVTLLTANDADVDASAVRAIKAEVSKSAEVEFTATGKREEGEHATGKITLSNQNRRSVSVQVGHAFSNGNCTFTATTAVTVPGYTPGNRLSQPGTPGTADVSVKATQPGDECNLTPRTYQVNSEELDPEDISARGSAMTGGALREVTFVTQADVQKATEELADNSDDSVIKELEGKLGAKTFVIKESFAAEASSPVSTPEIGDEAKDGKAKLAVDATYVMYGVEEAAVTKFIEQAVTQKLSEEDNQRVYDVRTDTIQFKDFSSQEYGGVAMLVAEAEVGPDVSDSEIKDIAKGKRFGEIQAELRRMQGIDNVEVQIFPSWVSTVPDDNDRVTVKFSVED